MAEDVKVQVDKEKNTIYDPVTKTTYVVTTSNNSIQGCPVQHPTPKEISSK